MKRFHLLHAGALIALLAAVLFALQAKADTALVSPQVDTPSPYDWYRYQGDKKLGGDCWAANANCGPAAVASAIQYAKHEAVPLTEIRNVMGGSCSSGTDDTQIAGALSHWNVSFAELSTFDEIRQALVNGHPVIAVLHMGGLSQGKDWLTGLSDPSQRSDLYKNPGNHWLVLKGMTDDGQWLRAYDPNVFDGNSLYFYNGWAPKGKDRYYRASEVASALLGGQSSFEIREVPQADNFTGTVTRAGQPAGGATVVFSDNRSRQASIRSNGAGRYAFSSLYPADAIVAAISGNQIGAAKAAEGEAQTIPLQASSNRIILPQEGGLRVTFISTGSPGDQTGCSGTFSLGGAGVIFSDYLTFSGLNYDVPAHFSANQELVFSLTPTGFCSGRTYYSTDPARAVVAHPTETTWIVSWEDWTDADFNDLTVRIDLQPKPLAYLQSPAANPQGGLVAAAGSAAGAVLPPVEYYFDHKYPTDGVTIPDSYPYAVTFNGYDSVEPSFSYQAHQSYSGNDGTDFILPDNSPVFPAADGIVKFAGQGDEFCALKNARVTQWVVKVQHGDGYTTEYWGLAAIDPQVVTGATVTRAAGVRLGQSGTNPCTGSSGFHFVLRNPRDMVVDPFGWHPAPDSHWYQVEDPWQTFIAGLQLDATSYPLWDAPAPSTQLMSPSVDNEITSTSGQIDIALPAYASSVPLKVQLEEGSSLPIAGLPGSIGSFTVNGFALGDQLVPELNAAMTISYVLPQIRVAAAEPPAIYYWDVGSEAANKWTPLATVWDPGAATLQAETSQFGTFAVAGQQGSQLFLPALAR